MYVNLVEYNIECKTTKMFFKNLNLHNSILAKYSKMAGKRKIA